MSSAAPRSRHGAPQPGVVACVYAVLFLAGLAPVTVLGGMPHFPGPYESAATIAAFFRERASAALACAFFQFGAAIPLGIFTASMVSRLRFHGVSAAGTHIALFGGFLTATNLSASSLLLWVLVQPGVADSVPVLHALYYAMFALGGVGFSVPLGLLIAGIGVTAAFAKLLPRWLVIAGLVIAVIAELSTLTLILPAALPLIPLTRFPAFLWLALAGFHLPSVRRS